MLGPAGCAQPGKQARPRILVNSICVNSNNEQAKKLNMKMGFKLECTLTQATPDGDILIFRMFREECKYLRGKYALSN